MKDLIFSLEVCALGFLVVMIALALLAAILELFHRLFGEKEPVQGAGRPAGQQLTANKTAVHKPPAARPVAVQPAANDLVAATMGAILCCLESGGYRSFTIKEIRPFNAQQSNWALNGRTRLLSARQDFVNMRRKKR